MHVSKDVKVVKKIKRESVDQLNNGGWGGELRTKKKKKKEVQGNSNNMVEKETGTRTRKRKEKKVQRDKT